jgi:hypothetical protein
MMPVFRSVLNDSVFAVSVGPRLVLAAIPSERTERYTGRFECRLRCGHDVPERLDESIVHGQALERLTNDKLRCSYYGK